MWLFNKSKHKEKDQESIFRSNSSLIEVLTNNVETIDKEEAFKRIKEFLINYFNDLFDIKDQLTEYEIIDKLRNFNVSSETINKAKSLFDFMTKIEYNNLGFTKKDIYRILQNIKYVLKDIYMQTKVNALSKKDMIVVLKQDVLIKKFEKNFEKVKNYYKIKKYDVPPNMIIKAAEYYSVLSSENKEKYSKDFNYYCKKLPRLMEQLSEAKKLGDSNQEKLHQLISDINKIFIKLDDTEKNEIYPLILETLGSDEEKLNIGIMIGYGYIHQKKIDEATKVYNQSMDYLRNLDESKKTYYYGVIKRYLENLRMTMEKKEKHEY